jgi:hypothetical protein
MSVNPDSPDNIEPIIRTTQIISGALIAGVMTFFLIVLFLIHVVGFGAAMNPGQAAGPNAPGAANPAAGQQQPQSIPILTYVCVAFALVALPMSFVLPNIVATQALRAASAPKSTSADGSNSTAAAASVNPAAAFQTSVIVGGAINEGAAFFAGVAYLIEQNTIALGVLVVLLAALVVRFPTRERAERSIAIYQEKLRSGLLG